MVEVGPRDGLQNEPQLLTTEIKAQLIQKLAQAGFKTIEATSFVRPDRIPQMRDAQDLFAQVKSFEKSFASLELPCLVPNERGLNTALSLGVKQIAVFIATSETFNQKNANFSLKENRDHLGFIMKKAKGAGIKIRGYVSTVFGCPYEGETSLSQVVDMCAFLLKEGAYEISLGDTIGHAVPGQVDKVLGALKKEFDLSRFALHFHDTRGMALANTLVGLSHGIEVFDSSVAGLGGCPYAKGATGNVASEEMLYLFNSMGIETGVDLSKLMETGQWLMKILKRQSPSKFVQAFNKKASFFISD